MAALLILYLCFANLCIVNAATSESFVGTVPETGIEAPEGYQVTLVVDGVETEIVPGTSYTKEDNAVVVYTNAKGLYGSYNGRGEEEYRTALFVDNTGIVEEKSVTEAIAEEPMTKQVQMVFRLNPQVIISVDLYLMAMMTKNYWNIR